MQSARQLLYNYHPVSVTNFFTHASRWPFASFNDVVFRNPKFKPYYKDDKGLAIICVHGIADRTSAFDLILDRIKDGLPENISSIHLISSDQRFKGIGIPDYALQLKNKLLAAGVKDIIAIGHSRGALIVSDFAERLSAAADIKVHAVLAIGGPFAGSWLAVPPLTWLSYSIAQMQKNSEFLTNLSAAIKVSKIPYYFFAAENDFLVAYESSYIGDHPILKYKRHGHVSILSSHKMVADILKVLDKVAFQKKYSDILRLLQGCSRPITEAPSHNDEAQMFSGMIDDFVELEAETRHKLTEACDDITKEIARLKGKSHFRSPKNKILVLDKLKSMLSEIDVTRLNSFYPEAMTLDKFIDCFLQDKTIIEGTDPEKVLSQPLTGIFEPASAGFIHVLRDKNKNILLRAQAVKQPELKATFSNPQL